MKKKTKNPRRKKSGTHNINKYEINTAKEAIR